MLPLAATFLALLAGADPPRHVLVLIADDLGVDQLASYGVGEDLPATPTLDALAAAGVRFRHAIANPLCSPTRATWQTGRLPREHLVGTTVAATGVGLDTDETLVCERLPDDYATAYFGKWHLSSDADGGAAGPNLHGWQHFDGALYNLDDYFLWERVVDGVGTTETGYATSVNVDAAIDWIEARSGPWLVVVAFNAPHKPFHEPPPDLHGIDDLSTARAKYKAAVEALDTETGRLLASIRPATLARTTVIVFGDNGTVAQAVVPPFDPAKAKPTLYEGGIRVPLIVAAASVVAPGREVTGPVAIADVHATILALAGVEPGPDDGLPLTPYLTDPGAQPARRTVVAETFTPNGLPPAGFAQTWRRAIRDHRYKLIWRGGPVGELQEELYDLWSDPFEETDLLEGPLSPAQQAAYDALVAAWP